MSRTEKLLDICDFQGGTQPPKEEWISEPRDGYIRMLQIRDYTQGDEKFIEYVLDNGKLHKCNVDDIMLSRYGYIGQAFTGLAGAYNVALVKVIKKKHINTQYLLYYFRSVYFQRHLLENVGARATIPGFNKTELKNALINIPDESRQIYIADTLERIEGIIQVRRKELQTLDDLIKARFVEMFGDPVSNPKGWEKKALSDEAEIKIGPFGSLLHKEDYITGGHALVNPSHIVEGKIAPDDDLTISDDKYTELAAYHLREGDVVMGRRGEMGRCAVVDQPGLLCGTGSLLIRSKGDLSADYIQKIISFPSFKRTIEDMAVGQTMPNLNVPIVSAFQIIKPPKCVQEEYYAFVDQVDKSKAAVQKALDEAQLLFDSLMQQYFG